MDVSEISNSGISVYKFKCGDRKLQNSEAVHLLTCIGCYKINKNCSDFTVVVGDLEFHCHKAMLSSSSSFFSSLLRNDVLENKLNTVHLPSIRKETFQVILDAIYKGKLSITGKNIIDVWHAVHMLDISFLLEECEKVIAANLNLNNYIQFLYLGNFLDSVNVIHATQK